MSLKVPPNWVRSEIHNGQIELDMRTGIGRHQKSSLGLCIGPTSLSLG